MHSTRLSCPSLPTACSSTPFSHLHLPFSFLSLSYLRSMYFYCFFWSASICIIAHIYLAVSVSRLVWVRWLAVDHEAVWDLTRCGHPERVPRPNTPGPLAARPWRDCDRRRLCCLPSTIWYHPSIHLSMYCIHPSIRAARISVSARLHSALL